MTDTATTNESPSNILCKACGLCCSGHLFAWTRLSAQELDAVQALGLNIIQNNPRQLGFAQPCPLWDGTCTAYTSSGYPRACKKYRCIVLRRLLDDDISLPDALSAVEETLTLIREIEPLLPASSAPSFRERLITHKEILESKGESLDAPEHEFLQKTEILLIEYEDRFGVDDFIDFEK
jgi:hypothetical protein